MLFALRSKAAATDNESRSVIAKLLGFTFAMVILPIGSYFVTVNSLFGGMVYATPLKSSITG